MSEVKDNISAPEASAIDATIEAAVNTVNGNLPTGTATSFWGKIKAFLLQEVEEDNFWFKKITLEPAPVVDGKAKSFLFRNITLR